MNSKSKSKTRKKTKISILRLVFFIIILILIGRIFYGLFITHPRIEVARYGNIELSETVTGYIAKNETVIRSPATGQVFKLVPEGTRVKKGVNVVSIIKNSSIDEYNDKIKKIDQEISQIKENKENTNLFEEDSDKIETKILEQLEKVVQISNSGNIENLPQIKQEINNLINKKLKVSGEFSFSNMNLENKIKEKEQYLSYINASKTDVPTSASGILSFNVDGYEQVLSPQNIEKLTTKTIENLVIGQKSSSSEHVIAGQPLVKIINNFEWYILCVLKTSKVEPLKQNDNINVVINNKKTIPAKVYFIKDEPNGKSLVSLLLTSNLEHFYNQRKVDVKIIKRNYEGIKIPISSLICKGEKRGVLIIDKGITKFKEVDVLGFNDEYAIVSTENQLLNKKGLSLNDEIIVNPLRIKEGLLIK